MSLFPYYLDRPSSRLLDQQFGQALDIDDLIESMSNMPGSYYPSPMSPMSSMSHYFRPWRHLHPRAIATRLQDSGSRLVADRDKFQVCLDVQQFAPDEITVKTVGNQIVVEGRHEEKQDEHGFVSRHFVRKYELPEGYKAEDVVSSLSSDGVLSVMAPSAKKIVGEGEERVVAIQAAGPARDMLRQKGGGNEAAEEAKKSQ